MGSPGVVKVMPEEARITMPKVIRSAAIIALAFMVDQGEVKAASITRANMHNGCVCRHGVHPYLVGMVL